MLFTQKVQVIWTDGTVDDVEVDQRDIIAAADAGAPMPTDGNPVALMKYLRAAAFANLTRNKKIVDLETFDDRVVEVAPNLEADPSKVEPTNPAT